jgi:formylglycine-generating enzyme required for sulfatase activity
MNCVEWYAADRFCRAQNKRLPTAEEWQLAATGIDHRIYPWGNAEPDDQHCCRSLLKRKRTSTCESGTHFLGDSSYGVHDMAGNVAEWTASKAQGTAGTAYEVYGGGYVVDAMETPEWRAVRTDLPAPYAPTHTAPDIGFRCVSDST